MARQYQYQPLRDGSDQHHGSGALSPARPRGPQARRLALALGLTFSGLVILLFASTWYAAPRARGFYPLLQIPEIDRLLTKARGEIPQLPLRSSCHDQPNGYQCRPEISHYWGQYSPFYSIPSELSNEIPSNCELTFAQVLSRHGSRDPTLGRTVVMAALLKKLQLDVREFKGPYAFLKKYQYQLGADHLTEFGEGELVRSGTAFYKRYRALTKTKAPFVRAAGQERVVVSAEKFVQGMGRAALDDGAPAAKLYPLPLTVVPEGRASNNTLSAELCDAVRHEPYISIGRKAQLKWAQEFVPRIAARLNVDLPGASLTISDVIVLMDFCPYTTVANPDGKLTPFCDLFNEYEWRNYDYFQTLGKYYGHGPGHPLGSTQGVGFVNELIARLTGQPVSDHTTVNHTLDSSPSTFPIGPSHALFADFSHDNDMVSIYAALGLYNDTAPLDQTHRNPPLAADGFASSWTVPFAGRMYVEKMRCHAESHVPTEATVEKGPEDGDELVRILINDRVVPLRHCDADSLGRCRLDRFVKSLGFARSGGKWDECFRKPYDD